MRLSKLVGARFKENPSEATLASHAFLLRGGYARQLVGGIYSLLPPGLRIVRKIERILRQEMDRIGGQEVLMPLVQPRELWEESGRYSALGPELLRFKDRTRHDMVLAMTHEEAVVNLVRHEISSHTQLPFMVYQIQTKFRDEPRSRGGLIRVREFTMKDAYSFHATQHDLEAYYQECLRAYHRIFARVGLPDVVAVESDTGMMGGLVAHEFMLLTEVGEDTIVTSDDGAYLANQEVATGIIEGYPEEPRPLEKVHTPGQKTIEDVAAFLGLPPRQMAKVVFYDADREGRLVMVLIRGDREVNEFKLAKIIGVQPLPAGEEIICAAGAEPGYASPMGLDLARVRLVVDHTIRTSGNLVAGANEADYHYKNFNPERDLPGAQTVDVVKVTAGDRSPAGTGTIMLRRGIEVGNIIQLGIKYCEPMGMTFMDKDGRQIIPLMGCYGIGVNRLLSAVMEAHHDKFGPRWPMSIAPWQVHICALRPEQGGVGEAAEKLYRDLKNLGAEVLYDDRGAQPGVQFADADLLGVPLRIIIGERNLKQGIFEWKRRDKGESGTFPVEGAQVTIKGWIDSAIGEIDAIADSKHASSIRIGYLDGRTTINREAATD